MAIRKHENPITLFHEWFEEAKTCGLREPTAVCLSTADATGMPSSRMILYKKADDRGFVFYTNLGSQKVHDLKENPRAALCFYWMPLGKQVRVEGTVEPVSDEEADAYFSSRDRQSQIGAWASKQSKPLEGYFELERRAAEYAIKFGIGKVPRPDFWSGYRIIPSRMEFWLEKPFRLHERLNYTRTEAGWGARWLFP
ncbi:MAG: pyridoxamine 5'-phosphate oxidase [Candidatus Hydrogenedentes bacterium]|nr:pyridoxamine 5'-phosphate oxidase [Candidatus Hydrogenedentota bacterium]